MQGLRSEATAPGQLDIDCLSRQKTSLYCKDFPAATRDVARLAKTMPSLEPDLDSCLRELEERTTDPREGIFGPRSVIWRINRHALLFLGSGRAALLQLAHPWVAQAIEDHSSTRSDPYGRFQRTFRRVFAMVYGDLDSAIQAARKVGKLHGTIRGELREDGGASAAGAAYRALHVPALLWVHSTLWETSIRVYETFVAPISHEDKETYYRETKRFALLFGITNDSLPERWDDFLDYNRAQWTSREIVVTKTARRLAHEILTPPDPLFAPISDRFRIVTSALLPAPVRDAFELPYGSAEERTFERTVSLLRRVLPRLPRRLRYVPPYLDATRRLEGRTGNDPVGRLMNHLYLGRMRAE